MRRPLPLRVYYVIAYAMTGVYLPYFPRWLEGRGIFGFRLGVISAAAPAMGIVAPAAFGVVADALGVRAGLLQIACAGTLVAFASLLGALALGAPLGFWSLLAAALLVAIFRAPMWFVADVVALEYAPSLGTTYGRFRLWGSLGFLAAAVVAGSCIDPARALPFPLACTAIVAVAFAASLALPRRARLPDRGDPRDLVRLLRAGDFRLFLLAAFLGNCAQAAYDLCFSIRLFDLGFPEPLVGVAWAIGTGAEVLVLAAPPAALRSQPPSTMLALALGGAALRWALIAVVRSPLWLLVLQPMHAISFGLAWLAEVTYAARRFPESSLGTAQGLFATAMGAGAVAGMLLWGPAYERAGGSFVFAGAAAFAVCATGFALALDRRVRISLKGELAAVR